MIISVYSLPFKTNKKKRSGNCLWCRRLFIYLTDGLFLGIVSNCLPLPSYVFIRSRCKTDLFHPGITSKTLPKKTLKNTLSCSTLLKTFKSQNERKLLWKFHVILESLFHLVIDVLNCYTVMNLYIVPCATCPQKFSNVKQFKMLYNYAFLSLLRSQMKTAYLHI